MKNNLLGKFLWWIVIMVVLCVFEKVIVFLYIVFVISFFFGMWKKRILIGS